MEFVKITDTDLTVTLTIPEAVEVERALKQMLGRQTPPDVFGRMDRQAALRVQHHLDAVLEVRVRI